MTRLFVFASSLLLIGLCGCSNTQQGRARYGVSSTEQGNAVQDVATATIEAKVKAIDYSNRMVTLVVPGRGDMTFRVSDNVKRLNEVKPGDTVVTEYSQSLAMELREPTAEERAHPTTTIESAARHTGEVPPGAAAARTFKTIVTVVGVDLNAKTITVRMPEGKTVTLVARRPERLERVKSGDTIAVSYTEAVAVSIEPKRHGA